MHSPPVPLHLASHQSENLASGDEDIFQEGNSDCIIPGQFEADLPERSEQAGGLLFSEKEIEAFNHLAEECETRLP